MGYEILVFEVILAAQVVTCAFGLLACFSSCCCGGRVGIDAKDWCAVFARELSNIAQTSMLYLLDQFWLSLAHYVVLKLSAINLGVAKITRRGSKFNKIICFRNWYCGGGRHANTGGCIPGIGFLEASRCLCLSLYVTRAAT